MSVFGALLGQFLLKVFQIRRKKGRKAAKLYPQFPYVLMESPLYGVTHVL